MNFRIVKTSVLMLFLVFIIIESYWRINYCNGEIYIQNQDLNATYSAQLWLDEELVGDYEFSPKDIIPHRQSLGGKIGNKHISIKRLDNLYIKEIVINTIFVKWVIVNINDDEDIWIENSIFPSLLQ